MNVSKMVEQRPDSRALLNMITQKLSQMNMSINQRQWHQVRVHERYIQKLIKVAETEDWWQQEAQVSNEVKAQYANMISQISDMKVLNEDKMQQLVKDREGILAYGLTGQD